MSYDVTEYFAQLVWMIVISQLVHGAPVYWHNIIVDNMLYRDIMTTGHSFNPPSVVGIIRVALDNCYSFTFITAKAVCSSKIHCCWW